MESRKAAVIPFPARSGVSYSAEDEKRNNVIGERLSEELKSRKLSKKEFCVTLKRYGVDVSQSALGKWTNGLTVPNAYQLLAICYALDLTDGLAAFTREYTPVLNEVGMEKVRAYREDLAATGKYAPTPKTTSYIRYVDMPVSNLRVSAGTGSFLDEDNFEMVSFPESAVPTGADFGVRISGNSMEPVYHDGQIVWVERCDVLSVGQVGVFIYDGEGFLKSYGEQEPDESVRDAFIDSYGNLHRQPVLISYNKDYPDRVISPERGFHIVGKVL